MARCIRPGAPRFFSVPILAVLLLAAAGIGAARPADRSTAHVAATLAAKSVGQVSVVVQARPGQQQDAARAVRAAGGQIRRSLTIVDGFAARLPVTALETLRHSSAVRQITPNSAVHFTAATFDAGSIADSYPKSTGATAAWSAGNHGENVTVALIDTGVAPVHDLAGRVVSGKDFSGERNSTLDSYGHGTVMAGIIAGDGTDSSTLRGGAYVGMAPRARVLSVKVAGKSGATDVSTVLAAMQWVASYRSQYNIRVVTIAWGTASRQSPSVDPLDYAVERLWRSGIAVVAAAGNSGPYSGTILKPGDDPDIITAGAYDDNNNTNILDDQVPAWSSRGPTAAGYAKPDVIAPGRTLVATRAPGSVIDTQYPAARVGASYIRGSGTSQASAVVSGAVALLLHARPSLTPDEVKYALTTSATPLLLVGSSTQGAGRTAYGLASGTPVLLAPSTKMISSGLGSLESSRGGRHITTTCAGQPTTFTIQGELDALCQPWNAPQWTADSWSADSWSNSSWSNSSWSNSSWSADSWSADSWSAKSWDSGFLTAFWGFRTPWWHRLPGEQAAARPRIAATGAQGVVAGMTPQVLRFSRWEDRIG